MHGLSPFASFRTWSTFFALLLAGLPLRGQTKFSPRVEKEVAAVYYNSKLKDKDGVPLTQAKLESFVKSDLVDERRGAAFWLGELSSLLEPDFIRKMVAVQLKDPDAEVRKIALMACMTCTGYQETVIRDLQGIIKEAQKDADPEVRKLARRVYVYSAKIGK